MLEVECAQRAMLKVIFSLPFRYPTVLLNQKAEVLSVRKLYILRCLRKYHKLTVPTLPGLDKRVFKCPIPLVNSEFARRHYNNIAPRLYNRCNKAVDNLLNSSNYQAKNKVKSWLLSLDYYSTESLLDKIY